MMLLALGLSFAAFTALSLAMEKHQRELQRSAARTSLWRGLGWGLLAVAFAISVIDHGWAKGPVLWLGALTVAGLLLAFGLYPYRPRWIVPLAWVLPVIGLAATVVP